MKLTRLRLIGFKSFVEPSDFLIEPGLTGVVGPNGCGKSNLVEALRWVMGEASHKAMRAVDMDDVIFSGSGKRPARNTAEVMLWLDNSDRTAPAQFNEQESLEVSRRIERDSGSAYRINNREARARDVQILFADASTGARSPALVHQGRVSEIIQAKPEARRRVLEEAAGISGLHARRHEAELRLKAAEHNLERLEDVISQLASQIDQLKRQARQAIRYRALSSDIRKAEAMLFHLRWIRGQRESLEAARARDAAVRLVAERTGLQAEAAKRQGLLSAELPNLRAAEARRAAALQRLTNARDELDREEKRARERAIELEQRLRQLDFDEERERTRLVDAQTALARLAAEEAALAAEAKGARQRQPELAVRVGDAEGLLADAEQRQSEHTSGLADLSARRDQLSRNVKELADRLTRLESEARSVEDEFEALKARRSTDLDTLAAALKSAHALVQECENANLRAEAAHSGARQALDVTRAPFSAAERRVQGLESEARTLRKLLDVESKKLWPPVLDLVTVDKGLETALGAALGDDLDAPIDTNAPMRWAGAPLDALDPSLPQEAEPLASHVVAPLELQRRLAQIGLVKREDGPRVMKLLKPGQRLVSREGDLWRWDGFAMSANAQSAAARRLSERNRLADVEREMAAARADLDTKKRTFQDAEITTKAAAEREAETRTDLRARRLEADAARDRCAAAEREMNAVTARLSALSEATVRLNGGREEAIALHSAAQGELDQLPAPHALQMKLSEIQNEVAAKRASLGEIRAEAQLLAREMEIAERRLQVIRSEQSDWNQRQRAADLQIEAFTARKREAAAEHAMFSNAPQQFDDKRRNLISEIAAAETLRQTDADRLTQAEAALKEADRAGRAALEAMSEAREQQARALERLEQSGRRIIELTHEIQEILEVAPDEMVTLAGIEPGQALPDASGVEGNLERMRRDRERLGGVNLRAEEELRSVDTQHNTLVSERDDLIEAIKRLRQGIQSLNREARERLTASFSVVDGHFRELFTTLFGGGTAELQLIESDDPLQAGLDILAKPPGKKPQSLSLLSGGEQALTALALIFAVFRTNPAPICVLDEVDAPLDDHNVERFCNLLDEMTRLTNTRFVIITHNPITMARMNRLFGVTMAERGVSQLVSVDLETASQFAEAG